MCHESWWRRRREDDESRAIWSDFERTEPISEPEPRQDEELEHPEPDRAEELTASER